MPKASEELEYIENFVLRKTNKFNTSEHTNLIQLYGEAINPFLGQIQMFMEYGGQLDNVTFGSDPKAAHRKARRSWLAGADDGEVGEFLDADFENDIVEYVDGAIDVSVISFGGLLEAVGGNLKCADILIKEVMRSNTSKLYGMEIREDGKIKKGPHFEPPRIEAILKYFNVPVPPVIGDSFKTIPNSGNGGGLSKKPSPIFTHPVYGNYPSPGLGKVEDKRGQAQDVQDGTVTNLFPEK